jgi:undecaprenyl-diphosphatase
MRAATCALSRLFHSCYNGGRPLPKEFCLGIFRAIILGIVQGATEFLPVSSSGHLVLVPAVFNWDNPSLMFDATVHLATMLSVIFIFWHDLKNIIVAWWQGLRTGHLLSSRDSRLGWWVIIGTIPGVLAGLLLKDTFEGLFENPGAVGAFLIVTACLLVLAEWLGKRNRDLMAMNWLDSILIGIGQAAAIAPGISRSGATMTVGMLRGLTRESAARFSFILALPIIFGAWLVQMLDVVNSGQLTGEISILIAGFLAAGISGYLAIRWLLAYVRKHRLFPFAVYCLVVGVLALIFL